MTDTIRLFGVPMDLGQGRRGVDMGPSAVRYAGLQERLKQLGCEVFDMGNIEVHQAEELSDVLPADVAGNAHYLLEVAAVCREVYRRTRDCVRANEKVIFIGGDHSISIGTIAGVAKNQHIGVLWIDAHADFNTPQTSPSGNIHGMPVSTLLGHGPDLLTQIGDYSPKLRPEQVVMIGIRDLDLNERLSLRESGIKVFTMRDIDEHGIAAIVREAVNRLSAFSTLHVSFDLDSLDPEIAPGVGTPVPGGLTYREAHLLMEMLADSGKVSSIDIVEINTILDTRNATAQIAVELIASLFGKTII